jgi:PAS domain S-box-containing protein
MRKNYLAFYARHCIKIASLFFLKIPSFKGFLRKTPCSFIQALRIKNPLNYCASPKWLRVALFIPLLILIFTETGFASRTVRVGAFSYFPAIYKASDGTIKGAFVEILDSIAIKEGWNLEFVYGSWDEGLKRIKSGEIDVLTSVAFTKERAAFMDYCTMPLLTVWSQVFTMDKSSIDGILDLKDTRIAVMRGDYNSTALRKIVNDFKVPCAIIEVEDFETVFKAIESGDVQAGVVNNVFGAGRSFEYNVKPTDIVFNPFDIFFTVKKGKNGDIRQALNRNLNLWASVKNSPHERAVQSILTLSVKRVAFVPPWIMIFTTALVVALLMFITFSLVLRIQIRKATTKLKANEIRLRQNEEKLRTIIDSLNDGLFIHDAQTGAILDVNTTACQLYGYSREELLKLHVEDISVSDQGYNQENALKHIKSAAFGYNEQFEWLSRDRNNNFFWVEITMSSTVLDGVKKILVLVRDITERKKQIDAMHKMQKLESIGILASGIAHDFNNLLGGIFGYVDLAYDDLMSNDCERAKYDIEKSLSVFERARELSRQLLTFAKGGAPVKAMGNIGQIVKETVQFSLTGSNVHPVFTIEEDLPSLCFDSNQIAQVIENLAINAKQAMDKGGALEIFVGQCWLKDGDIAVLHAGAYIRVDMKDHGCGVSSEYLEKIFDPFFTTKSTGTGLGLSMCWSIMSRHNGHISVKSVCGEGSVFSLYLPVNSQTDDVNMEPIPDEKKQLSMLNGCNVLIMDDEEYNREIVASHLKSNGCSVVAVDDGQKAVNAYLEAYKTSNPFHLVLLDLTVPGGVGGQDAASQIKAVDPSAKLIVISGYGDNPVCANPSEYGFAAFLPKPFRKDKLITMVTKLYLE